MKMICVIVLVMALLTGCGSMETFETLGEITHVSDSEPQLQQVVLTIPQEAVLEASAQEVGATMYACDGYTMVLQVLQSGDMDASVRSLSGLSLADVAVMQTLCGDHTRYDWVWTAAAEEGDLVCRAAILDDGNYHYALYTMALSQNAGALQDSWNDLFRSFCLES